jgi:hypothetical protein
MRMKDFIVGKTAYVVCFDWRSRAVTNYVYEVTVKSVGSKYVMVDTEGLLLPTKYIKGDKKDKFLSSVVENNRISKNHMLLPNENAAHNFLEYLELRNWFCRYVNWSPAGEFGVDRMSFEQLRLIEKILKDSSFARNIMDYEDFCEALRAG